MSHPSRPLLTTASASPVVLERPGAHPLLAPPLVRPRVDRVGRVPPRITHLLFDREGWVVLGCASAWYLAGAWYLLVYLQRYDPDALSRMANAFYVLYSREPHLAAIGFVWPPLLGALMLPPLLLWPVVPMVATHALAAGLISALAGALFVALTYAAFRSVALPRWANIGFAAALVANPMFWYYATNGMSEVPFMFLLLASAWLLYDWLATRGSKYEALVFNGFICGAALMIRYETLPWAVAMTGVVFLGAYFLDRFHPPPSGPVRADRAEALTLAFITPWLFMLFLWVYLNWQIVGDPLYFLTSEYSTAGQTGAAYALSSPILAPAFGSIPGALQYVGMRVLALDPLLLPLGLAAVYVALRHRAPDGLALLAVGLSIPALHVLLLYRGGLAPSFRYYMFALPATIMLAVWFAERVRRSGGPRRHVLPALLVAGGWLTVATSAWSMADQTLGQYTSDAYARFTTATPVNDFNAEAGLASYLDSLNLPEGSVLIDAATGYGVIVRSRAPRQFIINSDSDFQAVLADPRGRVAFVAVTEPGEGAVDVLSARYPSLFANGAPLGGVLAAEFSGTPHAILSARPTVWRLYRLPSA